MTDDTDTIKARYNRIAPFFDVMDGMMEWALFAKRSQPPADLQ